MSCICKYTSKRCRLHFENEEVTKEIDEFIVSVATLRDFQWCWLDVKNIWHVGGRLER